MKVSISIILLILYTMLALPAEAQKKSDHFDIYQTFDLNSTVSRDILIPSKPDLLREKKTESFNRKRFISGAVMILSGGAACLAGHIFAEQWYDEYKQSAFTENTEKLRQKVTAYTIIQIGGGLIGGTGVFMLMFSF